MAESEIRRLSETARQMRIKVLKMLYGAQSGHTGGSLSAIEILSALYFGVMRHDPLNPHWEERDRFVLSKGHAAPALYTALAMCGYFPLAELASLRQFGSRLQGHPCSRLAPGVDATSGSLGQGLSVANGIALGLRLAGNAAHTFVLLGDGELQEGQVWEAAMSAAHFRTGKLTAIVDNNGLQIDGFTKDVMGVAPIADKWRAFGWEVTEIDGHDLTQIRAALLTTKNAAAIGKPQVLIAKTIKGKGVSIFENKAKYHGVAPNAEELQVALQELGEE